MNEIFIRTDKGEYVGGETIFGIVYVHIHQPVESKGLKLKVKGYEKCEWEYSYVEQEGDNWVKHTGDKKDKKEFFRVDIKLIDYPGGFPVGHFSYPFQYTLPRGLPSVFSCVSDGRMKWSATVKYKVKAEVDIPGTKNDLKVTQPLIVREEVKQQNKESQNYTGQGTVRTCCCIPRGDVIVKARLDKAVYQAGQQAEITVDVVNQSSVDIEHFAVKLMRVVKLKGSDPHRDDGRKDTHCVLDTICENKYDGCKSGSQTLKNIPLQLWTKEGERQFELQPGTNGSIVKCSYHVDIEMQIPWAPDIEIHAPIQIYSPPNRRWEQWQPPVWSTQCQTEPVTGQFAVAAHLFESTTFAGMYRTSNC